MSTDDPSDAADKLEELRKQISDCHADSDDPNFLTDHTLRRYLVARDWDVHAAEKQLRETLEWRRETKPQHVVCTYCQKTPGLHAMRQVGFDRHGKPVLYFNFTQCGTQHNSVDDALQHVTYILENAARTLPEKEYSFVWVMDFTGMKMSSCNPRLGLAVERVLSAHYPERLGAFVCLNHGLMFHTFWKAVKGFICQKTVAKVYIHRSHEKVEEEFTELFPNELKSWMLEEIRQNKLHPFPERQKHFWDRHTHGSDVHDPRGCATFVKKYLDNFPVLDYQSGKKNIYLPHPNILSTICVVTQGK